MVRKELLSYPDNYGETISADIVRILSGGKVGRELHSYSPQELETSEGILVYFHQEIEGDEVVDTPSGFKHKYVHGVVVCGYRVNPTGILKRWKNPRIRPISLNKRETVKSQLVAELEKKPEFVDFWHTVTPAFS